MADEVRNTQFVVETATNVGQPVRATQFLVETVINEELELWVSQLVIETVIRKVVSGTRKIRRLRQTPHLSEEEAWLFYHLLELELEAGVGLRTGQGSDPMVMLQVSRDHGQTWSDERWVSAGKQGEYAWRAVWRRLGRARDMVFRFVISDPVLVAWVDAWIDVTKGTS